MPPDSRTYDDYTVGYIANLPDQASIAKGIALGMAVVLLTPPHSLPALVRGLTIQAVFETVWNMARVARLYLILFRMLRTDLMISRVKYLDVEAQWSPYSKLANVHGKTIEYS